jgi:Capsule polysaccharide biosynthesis protein
MKRVTFIGYGDSVYIAFLNNLSSELEKYQVRFTAIYFGRSDHDEYVKSNFPYLGLVHMPEATIDTGKFFSLFRADFYIIWNGYHDIYAKLREYLDSHGIPYVISEFTGIDKLFHFDKGLHGESSFLTKSFGGDSDYFLERNRDVLGRYVRKRTAAAGNNDKLTLKKRNDKTVLYIGVWDDAAGLSPTYPDVRRKISPFFDSSIEACNVLANNISKDDSISLVVKPHPGDNQINKDRYKDIATTNKNAFYADESYDVDELLDVSDVVVTISSTLSILAAFNLKPLLLLGRTYLSNSPYPYQLKREQDVWGLLQLALSKSDWSSRVASLDKFFHDFIVENNVFSSDNTLKSIGAKDAVNVASVILNELRTEQVDIADYNSDFIYNFFSNNTVDITQLNNKLMELQHTINSMKKTLSWRITRPLRIIGSLLSLEKDRG